MFTQYNNNNNNNNNKKNQQKVLTRTVFRALSRQVRDATTRADPRKLPRLMVLGKIIAQQVARVAQTYLRDSLVASPRFRQWARNADKTMATAPDVLQREVTRRFHSAREQLSAASDKFTPPGAAGGSTARPAGAAGSSRTASSSKPGAGAPDFATRASAFASALREELEKDFGGAAGGGQRKR